MRIFRGFIFFALLSGLWVFPERAVLAQINLPALTTEIAPEHPLLMFKAPDPGDAEGAVYAEGIRGVWKALPETLKPYSALLVKAPGADVATRHLWYGELLQPLQAEGVPTVIVLADEDPRHIYPLDFAEELVAEFTLVKGVHVSGLRFNEYYNFGNPDPLGVPPQVQWLIGAIDLAGRYGRFISIQLDELHWPRIMSNAWCRPLYDKLEQFHSYTIGVNDHRGDQNLTRSGALLGLWLEGGVGNWGIGARSGWYHDARYIRPGVFGVMADAPPVPSSLYRAMILNGAAAGATVYVFSEEDDLWFGKDRYHWDEAILPTLEELIDAGFIGSKEFVRKKTHVAYKMTSSDTALDFHLNLRDIDAVYDEGYMIQAAYGIEPRRQVPELVPNTGAFYWLPIFSPYVRQEILSQFDEVVHPGMMHSAEQWTEVLQKFYRPDGLGTAFITRVGRVIFVMNTRENTLEAQSFRIPNVPSPVRRIEAYREADAVRLTWPFREGDVAYTVYKRTGTSTEFKPIADDLDERRFIDVDVDPFRVVTYSVSALTNEVEPYEGTVNYGEYKLISAVESRLEEEVVLEPFFESALSLPIAGAPEHEDNPGAPPWPNVEGLEDKQLRQALAIVQQIEAWDWAFGDENVDQVMDIYADDYADEQGWGHQYVRRAYQWFFERYGACRMERQIRGWDFAGSDNEELVTVRLYCRFSGVALTDSGGRFADAPAYFPRIPEPPGEAPGVIEVTFTDRDGPWRILRTLPALPNFKDILSFSTGPYDNLPPGPDE